MNTIKYLCEFFFNNFWHFLELVILTNIIFLGLRIKIKKKNVEQGK